jgi:hypothetical protein
VGNDHLAVACVISYSVGRAIWRHIDSYVVGSGHFAAMRVISHSFNGALWRHINVYIVVSSHLAVTCVISYSVGRAIWRHIDSYIVVSSHLAVTCVISHSVSRVLWRDIYSHIVRRDGTQCDLCCFLCVQDREVRCAAERDRDRHSSTQCVLNCNRFVRSKLWWSTENRTEFCAINLTYILIVLFKLSLVNLPYTSFVYSMYIPRLSKIVYPNIIF